MDNIGDILSSLSDDDMKALGDAMQLIKLIDLLPMIEELGRK